MINSMSLDLNLITDIIHGRYDRVPDLRKKVVRIFISSTFTDTNAERDYLIEKINPLLKEYCKNTYDLEFQSVDMRWGIPSHAYEYHGTTDLCIKEIINCKQFSIGPNFVTLIGQKYGLRPLPTRIELDEFNILKNELVNELKEDLTFAYEDLSKQQIFTDDLIEKCYKLNTNSNPYRYHIQAISKVIPDYKSTEPGAQDNSRLIWEQMEAKISMLLRKGARSAFDKNLIDKIKLDRYFVSVTAKEIYEGIEKVENPNKTALCFVREIVNLEENINDPTIPRFMDIKTSKNSKNNEIDQEAKNLLLELRDKKIPAKLDPKKNIFYFKVKWKDNKIDEDDLKSYLERFGKIFYDKIKKMIDEAMTIEKQKDRHVFEAYKSMGLIKNKIVFEAYQRMMNLINAVDYEIDQNDISIVQEFKELITELGTHANEFHETIKKFDGRDYILNKIKEYILSDNDFPYVLTGQSGCGKTSLMAITHQMIPNWVKNPSDYLVITRFLGTTVQTSSIYKTFSSIALQLHYVLNFFLNQNDKNNYENYCKCQDITEMKEFILYELKKIINLNPTRKIVIILDSLDQLTPNDYKNVDKWFFTDLPPNVKFIVSTIPDHGNLLNMITKIIKKRYNGLLKNTDLIEVKKNDINEPLENLLDSQIFHVKELNANESERILFEWLKNSNQILTDEQWNDLRHIFNNGTLLPLFLKLIYDIVIMWCSYDKADEELLKCKKTDDIIMYMFHYLEKKHGHEIVSRAICYMTICKNGISNNELEDILSLDDDVLFNVFQFHLPPVRRLPPILWIRIKYDLREYIVEKEANDTKVIFWYHRRFVEVALENYVKKLTDKGNEVIFQNMFDFYNETWKDKQKPFELNDYLKKKIKNEKKEYVADRHISSQPIEFIGEDGAIRYNKRKLAELPNCLTIVRGAIALEKSCELIFFNYEFMHAKLVCESINEVREDLKNIMEGTEGWNYKPETKVLFQQLKLFRKLINMIGNHIGDYPDSFAFEFTSRCLSFYGHYDYITKLIDACDKISSRSCAFISPYLQQQPPGGFLLSSLAKDSDPIIKIYIIEFFLLTYSSSRIIVTLCRESPEPIYLFECKLPSFNKLEKFYTEQKIKSKRSLKNFFETTSSLPNFKTSTNNVDIGRMKCLYERSDILDISDEIFTNPDLLPVLFLIIHRHYAYILSPNKQIKFVYMTDVESDLEILDILLVNNKQLIIIEKNSFKIKVFQNYEQDPNKYSEFEVANSNNQNRIKECHSTSSLYVTSDSKKIVEILLVLENGELRQFIFKCDITNGQFDSDSSNFLFGRQDNAADFKPFCFDTDCSSYSESDLSETGDVSAKFNDNLYIEQLNSIKCTGLNVKTVLHKVNQFLLSGVNGRISFANVYLSCEDGTLVILFNNKNKIRVHVFKNFTTEPILEIISCITEPKVMGFRTENYSYIVHKGKNKDGKKGLCKLELNGKIDYLHPVDKHFFLICRYGIIELYKIKCLKETHRLKFIFSINSLSSKCTDLILIQSFLFCATVDGILNTYNFISGKRNEKIYPSFDRTYYQILKSYTSLNELLSVSKHGELAFWRINNGKITKKLFYSEKDCEIKKVKMDFKNNILMVLLNNAKLIFYKDYELDLSINLKSNSAYPKKIVFLNRFNINQPEKPTYLFDLVSCDLFEVKFLDGIQLKNFTVSQKNLGEDDKILASQLINDQVIVYSHEMDIIIFIDKFLKKFSVLSYDGKHAYNMNKTIPFYFPIRYNNFKDDKKIKNFMNTFGRAEFKYKVIKINGNELYFSISALRKYDEIKLSQGIASSLFVYSKIITTSNRKDKNIELEILSVYPFCKKVVFFEDYKTLNKTNPSEKIFFMCINYLFDTTGEYVLSKPEYYTMMNNQMEKKINKMQIINIKENKSIFEIDLNSNNIMAKKIAVDSKCEYLVFNDKSRLLWLFRIKDSRKLACLPLYGYVNQIKFNLDNAFVCLSMNDRRIFNLLIVDPEREDHKNRIKELPSRQLNKNGVNIDKEVDSNEDDQNEKVKQLEMMAESDDFIYSSDEDIDSTFSSENGDEEEKFLKEQEELAKKKQSKKKLLKQPTITKRIKPEETIEKIRFIPKQFAKPIKVELNREDTNKPNWLKDFLDNYEANKENKDHNKQIVAKSDRKSPKTKRKTIKKEKNNLNKNHNYFNRFNLIKDHMDADGDIEDNNENNDNLEEHKTLRAELNAMFASKMTSFKLGNSGKMVRAANNSSTCLLS